MALEPNSGRTIDSLELSGVLDVIFLDAGRSHLYVAIGEPGVIDVVDASAWKRLEVVPTEPGAHTIAVDAPAQRAYAFLPESHRAMVFQTVA